MKISNNMLENYKVSSSKVITKNLIQYEKVPSPEFNLNNKKIRYYHLSHKCIYGTDANPRMARTAKMNMIMHGDGHGGVHHHDGLIDVNGVSNGRFDVILTNPPSVLSRRHCE